MRLPVGTAGPAESGRGERCGSLEVPSRPPMSRTASARGRLPPGGWRRAARRLRPRPSPRPGGPRRSSCTRRRRSGSSEAPAGALPQKGRGIAARCARGPARGRADRRQSSTQRSRSSVLGPGSSRPTGGPPGPPRGGTGSRPPSGA